MGDGTEKLGEYQARSSSIRERHRSQNRKAICIPALS